MKFALTTITFLICTLWCSKALATGSQSLKGPVKIPSSGFTQLGPNGTIVKVYPKTRENCKGWVQLSFIHKQDIYKGDLEILDSNPPGKYDEEAINELLKLLSTQIPMHNSKLETTVDDSGQKWSIYTYSVECKNWEIISQSKNN